MARTLQRRDTMNIQIGQLVELDLFGLALGLVASSTQLGTVIAVVPGAITVRLHARAARHEVTISHHRVLRAH